MRTASALILLAACAAAAGGNIGRDLVEVREVMSVLTHTIQEEYSGLLESSPGVAGEVSVTFFITPEGTATGVTVEASEGLLVLVPVVTATVEALDFGEAEDQQEDIEITVPFTLSPPVEAPAGAN